MLAFLKSGSSTSKSTTVTPQLNTLVYYAAAQVPSALWQSIIPTQQWYMQLPYLLAQEQVLPSHIQSVYAIHTMHNVVVAAYYAQLITLNAAQLQALRHTTANQIILKTALTLLPIIHKLIPCAQCKILVIGNSIVTQDYMMRNNSTYSNMACIHNLITHVKKKHPIEATIIKDAPFSLEQEIKKLSKPYQVLPLLPTMQLPIAAHWHTMHDYTQQLLAKYRTVYHSCNKKLAPIRIQQLSNADVDLHQDQLYTLLLQVINRNHNTYNTVAPNYFSVMKHTFPHQFYVLGYFLHNELIGFASYFATTSVLEAAYVGLNYDYNTTHKLYQNMLYQYVQSTIEHKCTMLNLSRTATEIKSVLGAVPTYYNCYITIENKLVKKIVTPIIQNLKSDAYTIRSPFKKTASTYPN